MFETTYESYRWRHTPGINQQTTGTMKFNLDFLTEDSKWEVHLQESCAVATHKADEFNQSL